MTFDKLLAADYVGLNYAPPYLAPTTHGNQILQGVNYASGAGESLDESGAAFVSHHQSILHHLNNTVRICKLGFHKRMIAFRSSHFF
jgi:hypothetical protein